MWSFKTTCSKYCCLILLYVTYPFFNPIFFHRIPASSPTKLLCFTRSSPLVDQLLTHYSFLDAQTASTLVFPDPSQLVVYTLSSLESQSSIQEMLKEFVLSDKAEVSFQAWKHDTILILYMYHHSTKLYQKISQVGCYWYHYECAARVTMQILLWIDNKYHHSTKLYHEFVAICILTSAQFWVTIPTATNKWYFFHCSLVLWW